MSSSIISQSVFYVPFPLILKLQYWGKWNGIILNGIHIYWWTIWCFLRYVENAKKYIRCRIIKYFKFTETLPNIFLCFLPKVVETFFVSSQILMSYIRWCIIPLKSLIFLCHGLSNVPWSSWSTLPLYKAKSSLLWGLCDFT